VSIQKPPTTLCVIGNTKVVASLYIGVKMSSLGQP